MTSKGEYIDPKSYDSPMDLLRNFASEIDRNRVKLDNVVGGGTS